MPLLQTLSEYAPPKPTFTEANLPPLDSRIYLITGGAAGIGKELARMLYSANATVYIAGRNLTNIENAKKDITERPSEGLKPTSGRIEPMVFDLSDLSTIKSAVNGLLGKIDRLDGLFLNAGVMNPPTGSTTKQGFELQWGTNVVGHFLLQQLLIPILRRSAKINEPVRIMWTSSDGSNFSPSPDGIHWADIQNTEKKLSSFLLYPQSKAGNVIVAAESARRYASDNLIFVSLNPGHLKTDLQRHHSPLLIKAMGFLLYDARYGALTELYAGFSNAITKKENGAYLIPWGRIGIMAPHIRKGLQNGSGSRLWEILERDIAEYA